MNSITSCNNLGESSYLKHLSAMTMKCNVCGQEFGNGAYCQHCNADRITALGNYSGGYNAPDIPKNVASNTNPGGSDPTSGYSYGNAQDSNYTHKQGRAGNGVEQFMICYHCTNVIPADSEYCPCCGTKLFVVCPKCGHRYSSQYKICNKCGTNKEEYLKEQRILEQHRKEEVRREAQLRQEELERQRRKIESTRPQILSLEHVKSSDNLSIEVYWNTRNCAYCTILMRDKDVNYWKSPLYTHLPTFGSCRISTRDLISKGLANNFFFRSSCTIIIRLYAGNRFGSSVTQDFEINVCPTLSGDPMIN